MILEADAFLEHAKNDALNIEHCLLRCEMWYNCVLRLERTSWTKCDHCLKENKMWSLFKRESKCELCQIRYKCTQLPHTLQLQMHTQLEMRVQN